MEHSFAWFFCRKLSALKSGGASPLTFNSLHGVQSALAWAEGVATAADLQNFASGGVSLLIFESKEI